MRQGRPRSELGRGNDACVTSRGREPVQGANLAHNRDVLDGDATTVNIDSVYCGITLYIRWASPSRFQKSCAVEAPLSMGYDPPPLQRPMFMQTQMLHPSQLRDKHAWSEIRKNMNLNIEAT